MSCAPPSIRMRIAALLLAATATTTLDAARATPRLGRGVNILSTDGMFRPGETSFFSLETLDRLRADGFDHVRINALPFARLGPGGRLDEAWIATLRRMIDAALERGLSVVVDVHEFQFCQREPTACEVALDATWSVLAARLADYDDRVAFEILNEPGGAMDAARWNRLLARELATIRRLGPHRTVIVGTAEGSRSTALAALKLPPEDRDLLVAFHYYEPFGFTHQGAPWAGLEGRVGVDWGSAADLARLEADFDAVAAWARREGRPIYLGEFGVYERAAPRPRFCYLYRVARAAEARGWSWAYWQLTSDFRLLDEETGVWNDWLIAALTLPEDPATCRAPTPGRPVKTR